PKPLGSDSVGRMSVCQAMGRRGLGFGRPERSPEVRRDEAARTGSVATVPFLFPGVAVIVVAERLPEAGAIVRDEPQAPDPLRALPEVEVRHDQAGRPPVLWG